MQTVAGYVKLQGISKSSQNVLEYIIKYISVRFAGYLLVDHSYFKVK